MISILHILSIYTLSRFYYVFSNSYVTVLKLSDCKSWSGYCCVQTLTHLMVPSTLEEVGMLQGFENERLQSL